MSKLKILVPLVLVAMFGGYKFALAKPAPEPKPKVHGSVYVLGKEFLVNLADGRFAKVTVALVLAHDDKSTEPAGGHSAATPPEGFGPMGQEAIVRGLVTDVLTDARDHDLIDHEGREHLKEEILERLKKETDVKAHEVVFTDVTVQ
jgi:flagellar basal body-associated protein FliL